jgi:hypothetical protein
MSDVEYREARSATAFPLSIKRNAIRLTVVSLGLLITLAWNGALIRIGRLIHLW